MSSFIVTDKAIVELLLKKSDKKADRNQFDEQDAAFDKAIQEILKSINVDRLREEDYVLNSELRKQVISTTNEIYRSTDGEVIDTFTADDEKRLFEDNPLKITISDPVLGRFLDEVDTIDVATHFPNHELAFRIYFGHEKTTPKFTYGVLIVPICSPIVPLGTKRDHSKDLENSLLSKHGTHFALVVTENQKGRETDLPTWKTITLNKEHLSNTELVYFTLDRLKRFRNGTDRLRRTNMCIFFSRKKWDNRISAIISYLDISNNLLESDFHKSGLKSSGTFFNQGDLIPPNGTIEDKSF